MPIKIGIVVLETNIGKERFIMFCGKCGTELIDGICPKCMENENPTAAKSEEKFKDFFMSPKEKMVAVLGNSYFANFLQNHSMEKGFVVVSNKRVYFEGEKYYLDADNNIEKAYNSRIVDLKDVIGTGFDSFEDRSSLHFAIAQCILAVVLFPLFLIFLLIAIYEFYCYFKSKHTFIVIQYAGGEIGYEVKWFNNQEIDLFQKDLRLAKDKVLEKEDTPAVELPTAKQNSVADELAKLADLLSKEVITAEEFQKMKKDLI